MNTRRSFLRLLLGLPALVLGGVAIGCTGKHEEKEKKPKKDEAVSGIKHWKVQCRVYSDTNPEGIVCYTSTQADDVEFIYPSSFGTNATATTVQVTKA